MTRTEAHLFVWYLPVLHEGVLLATGDGESMVTGLEVKFIKKTGAFLIKVESNYTVMVK